MRDPKKKTELNIWHLQKVELDKEIRTFWHVGFLYYFLSFQLFYWFVDFKRLVCLKIRSLGFEIEKWQNVRDSRVCISFAFQTPDKRSYIDIPARFTANVNIVSFEVYILMPVHWFCLMRITPTNMLASHPMMEITMSYSSFVSKTSYLEIPISYHNIIIDTVII